MKHEDISTHDIRVGDRIAANGMVLLIDQQPTQTRHPVNNEAGVTLATRALVENWDQLVENARTDTYIAGFIVGLIRDDLNRGLITEPRWTIQGNGWARWARIVMEGE